MLTMCIRYDSWQGVTIYTVLTLTLLTRWEHEVRTPCIPTFLHVKVGDSEAVMHYEYADKHNATLILCYMQEEPQG